MKVAVPSDGPDQDSSVARRFGLCPYFLIADLDSGAVDVVENPGASGVRGAGVQAVVVVLNHEAAVLLTNFCAPAMRQHLEANGVEVISGVSGRVGEVLRRYGEGEIGNRTEGSSGTPSAGWAGFSRAVFDAARRSWKQLVSVLPILAGVVLLVGLFRGFVTREFLRSLFSGNAFLDTLWGACAGSIFTGNPVSSYIIGGELLRQGVSLFAVTALMLTWVTVGLVQLPAEMAALGRRFAITRNVLCFALAFPIALATVSILAVVSGGLLP